MAKQKPKETEQPQVEQPQVEQPQAEQPQIEQPQVEQPVIAPVQRKVGKNVRVSARIAPFVDLIKDITIGFEPVEVENHPWLQANIDSGNLIVAE